MGIKARYDYLPFGEEITSNYGGRSSVTGYTPVESTRQKFTGYERDIETGLDFAQARYYANTQGRFISADSVGGTSINPQTLNRYSYTANNPLNNVDPSGHMSFSISAATNGSEGAGFGYPDNASELPEEVQDEINRIKGLLKQERRGGAPRPLSEDEINEGMASAAQYGPMTPPQSTLPTHQEVRSLKPTSEQQRCSDYLAKLFGGNGAQAGANGFTPSGDFRGTYTYNGKTLAGHLSDYAIHVSGSKDQTKDTDIFVPLGGSRTLSTSDTDGNTIDLFHYQNLSGLGEYTLAVLHLDRSSPQSAGGRLHVGRTGGPGGGGANDRHVHIELLKGKWTTFPKPSIRGSSRTNLSVLCPGR